MVRLTDGPDMTLDVYRGRKQQYNNKNHLLRWICSIKKGYPLEAKITQKTENCRVYKFTGPD